MLLGRDYANPKMKIGRSVRDGEYIRIIRGLYETDRNLDGKLLADVIYSPSYLSFDYALSFHGLIPERVETYTSATTMKNRSKCYMTPFGRYTYQDVPAKAFPKEISLHTVGGYTFWIAGPEKAMCDKLCKLSQIGSLTRMEHTLLNDMRVYEEGLDSLDAGLISELSELYGSRNVSLFARYMERRMKV